MKIPYDKIAEFRQYQWTHHTFPNLTWAMYCGNEPIAHDVPMANGDFGDRWSFLYGNMRTYNGEVMDAHFILSPKVTIYIIGDTLSVCDNRWSGKHDEFLYCNTDKAIAGTKYTHPLEPDKFAEYLNCFVPNCKAWAIIQAKAKKLAENENYWETHSMFVR